MNIFSLSFTVYICNFENTRYSLKDNNKEVQSKTCFNTYLNCKLQKRIFRMEGNICSFIGVFTEVYFV
jgi:uncharacterized membrane protein